MGIRKSYFRGKIEFRLSFSLPFQIDQSSDFSHSWRRIIGEFATILDPMKNSSGFMAPQNTSPHRRFAIQIAIVSIGHVTYMCHCNRLLHALREGCNVTMRNVTLRCIWCVSLECPHKHFWAMKQNRFFIFLIVRHPIPGRGWGSAVIRHVLRSYKASFWTCARWKKQLHNSFLFNLLIDRIFF